MNYNNDCDFNKLIFKLRFINKNTDEKIKAWNDEFYILYRREKKRLFGKSLPECYFYGNKINKSDVNPVDKTDVNPVDKPNNYDEIIKDKDIMFSIYKYYTQKIESIDKKKYVLLKLTVFIYHINDNHYFINDLKYKNIGFDEKYNIITIDYDAITYQLYKTKTNKYVILKHPFYLYYLSCDVKKRLYSILNVNSDETNQYIEKYMKESKIIYSDDKEKNIIHNYNQATIDYLVKLLDAKKKGYTVYSLDYYLTDRNLYFDKFNVISIADVILYIFFNSEKGYLIYYKPEYFPKFRLNPIQVELAVTIIGGVSTFQNLNDIDLLTRFIYSFIQPIDGIDKEYIDKLKFLILDPITETGLLGTDFECVPPYELIAKFLKIINDDETPIYEQFKQMIDDNIGTETVLKVTTEQYTNKLNDNYKITNVGNDVKQLLTDLDLLHELYDKVTYEEWQLARLVEILMDRPDNRSDTSLDLPCVNSTLPQNYIITINTETQEIKTTIKWVKNKSNEYVESP